MPATVLSVALINVALSNKIIWCLCTSKNGSSNIFNHDLNGLDKLGSKNWHQTAWSKSKWPLKDVSKGNQNGLSVLGSFSILSENWLSGPSHLTQYVHAKKNQEKWCFSLIYYKGRAMNELKFGTKNGL